ncbi:MAG: hypothetical protein PHD65_07550 [Gallionella sp.]|nr:hypothetical protein [Gallionella sp.]
MKTIEEFMQSYFAEWTELNYIQEANSEAFLERFVSITYLHKTREERNKDTLYRQMHPAVILSVENKGETTEAIVSQPLGCEHELRLYHLRLTKYGWKIERKGWQCYFCKGSGRRDEDRCSSCDGVGWRYYGASDRK